MKIKNRIKLSFFIIICLVLLTSITNILITYQVKENAILKDKISKIILIQAKMNRAIQEINHSKTVEENNKLQKIFIQHEQTFESIRESIPLKESTSLFSKLMKDDKSRAMIIANLKELFQNEQKIETAFENMYEKQKIFIDLTVKFNSLYPKEKSERSNIYKRIFEKKDFMSIHYFGLTQYYSKETLYQHKTEKYLTQWLNSIEKTKSVIYSKTLLNSLNHYKKTVKKIGTTAIALNNIQNEKNTLQEKTSIVLENNKKLVNNILKEIENITTSVTDKLLLLSIIIIIVIIIFISIFSYRVSKNVSLSVDEIEDKIQLGLKEIKSLNKEIESTQKEVIFTMGTIAEYRSKETGNHVKRVAEYCKILALHYGLDEKESELLRQASPMHDIGKIAIPDAVLNKPGRFNDEEREIMNKHARLGYEMLNKSQRPLLKTAAIVAYEHHEKWDGSGYPRGLKGEDIHIYGRITALADVFDALGSDRVYKKAWSNDKIYKLFKEEKGKHFDPKLIDIFFANLDKFIKIQNTFKDI